MNLFQSNPHFERLIQAPPPHLLFILHSLTIAFFPKWVVSFNFYFMFLINVLIGKLKQVVTEIMKLP